MDISIIIPIKNGERWINNCMNSITRQTVLKTELCLEIVVCNDGSDDMSVELLEKWSDYFKQCGVNFIVISSLICRGVGAAKNQAVKKSIGTYLCFQDIDDVMHQDRILAQWEVAKANPNYLIGSQILRCPADSTPRFVRWANMLDPQLLKVQIYTSNGPTVLMPTWFCHRSVYDKVGGFDESGHGIPEDLIFFYKHIDLGGGVKRVDKELVIYTYHNSSATFSVTRERIWQIQVNRIQQKVLPYWDKFIIWNAGKAGRRLVRNLSPENMAKVVAFCDVDRNKIGRVIELYCPVKKMVIKRLPVIHFSNAKPPLLICIKLDLTNGEFEKNLMSMNLTEGLDYILLN